jgi:hypothetical protein
MAIAEKQHLTRRNRVENAGSPEDRQSRIFFTLDHHFVTRTSANLGARSLPAFLPAALGGAPLSGETLLGLQRAEKVGILAQEQLPGKGGSFALVANGITTYVF